MKKIYILLILFYLGCDKVFAQLASYQYKQGITITENSNTLLTNYQLKLIVNTQALISAGYMKADGSDIRFAKNCSSAPVLYNYWIDSGLNTSNTLIWVKVDSLQANQTKNMIMYYGNPSAAAVSAISGTFMGPHSSTDSVASGSSGGAVNSQRGFRFTPTEDLLVTHFGKREPNGTTRTVTLFNFSSQAILRQESVSGAAAQYNYSNISNPIWLTSGTQYILSLYQGPTDGYYFGSSSQIGQHLTYGDMRYCNSCAANTFPVSILTNFHYGYPDIWYWTKNSASIAPTVTLSGHGGAGGTSISIATTATTVCAGSPLTLSSNGFNTYSWSNGSSNDSITVTPANTSTYTLNAVDNFGCSANGSITITVNPLPNVTANLTSTNVCSGDSLLLFAAGANFYSWNNGVSNNVKFVPSANGNYIVTGIDVNGCLGNDTVAVTINALPTVIASVNNDTICDGSTVTLTGIGASSYAWDNGVTNGIAFTPASTQTYTVTGTDANGCSNTASQTITVNALPTVTANSTASAVCAGSTVTLTSGGASTYTWNNGVTEGVAFVPTSTLTYTVTGTDVNGCSNTASQTVTVNTLPTVTASASSSAVCAGNTVTLTGGGASTYSWDNGVTEGVAFVPTSTLTYTVTGTDANGCSNTASQTVTVNALPSVTASSTASAVCAGSTVTLSGGGASSYTWGNGVTNAVAFTPTSTQTYTVIGTDANGCSNTASVTVVVNANPSASVVSSGSTICAGGTTALTLTGAPAGGVFSVQSGTASALVGNVFNPLTVGNYVIVYTYTDPNTCSDTAQISFNVNCTVGLSDLTKGISSINIFPNPNNGAFIISSDETVIGNIELINELGQVVYYGKMNGLSQSIDAKNLSTGVYHLKLSTSQSVVTKRLSIVHR
jgi:hypothetical protein